MSNLDSTGNPESGRWSKIDHAHLVAVLVAAVGYALYLQHIAANAAMPPQADAGSHALHAIDVHRLFSLGPATGLEALIFMGGGYPTVLYCLSAVLFGAEPTAAGLPLAVHAVLVGSLVVAWPLARLLWGRPAAWLWVLFTAVSPYVVGYSSHYFLDLPQTALVGVGTLGLLHAQRLDRTGPGLLFGVLAGLGMLMKWTWLFFLAPPFAICVVVAVVRAARARQLTWGTLAGTLVATAFISGAFWSGWYWNNVLRNGLDSHPSYFFVAGGCVAVGAALLAWAHRAAAAAGLRGFYAAIAGGFAVAGPWYVLGTRDLYGLLVLHGGIHSERTRPLSFYLLDNFESFRQFFPFIELLTPAAVLVLAVFGRREGRYNGLLALSGAIGGFVAISVTVASDIRYVMPCLPMAAAVITAAVARTPNVVRWLAVAAVLGGGIAALQPRTGDQDAIFGANQLRQRNANPDVTWTVEVLGRPIEVLRDPSFLDFTGFYASLEGIRAACGDDCDVIVRSREDHWIQGRTFESAGVLAGLHNVRWALNANADDDPRERSPGNRRDMRVFSTNRPLLLVTQPCSVRPNGGADLERSRASVVRLLGAEIEPIASYPLPGSCSMYLDRVLISQPGPAPGPEAVLDAAPAPDAAPSPDAVPAPSAPGP
jgi:4-amino-4-deoxy-L-arabinose transferase-like glycosyltransferase